MRGWERLYALGAETFSAAAFSPDQRYVATADKSGTVRVTEKIVQRILRHAKPHVTKERYIKAFDPAVLDAMQRLQATVDVLERSPAIVQQMN